MTAKTFTTLMIAALLGTIIGSTIGGLFSYLTNPSRYHQGTLEGVAAIAAIPPWTTATEE